MLNGRYGCVWSATLFDGIRGYCNDSTRYDASVTCCNPRNLQAGIPYRGDCDAKKFRKSSRGARQDSMEWDAPKESISGVLVECTGPIFLLF